MHDTEWLEEEEEEEEEEAQRGAVCDTLRSRSFVASDCIVRRNPFPHIGVLGIQCSSNSSFLGSVSATFSNVRWLRRQARAVKISEI